MTKDKKKKSRFKCVEDEEHIVGFDVSDCNDDSGTLLKSDYAKLIKSKGNIQDMLDSMDETYNVGVSETENSNDNGNTSTDIDLYFKQYAAVNKESKGTALTEGDTPLKGLDKICIENTDSTTLELGNGKPEKPDNGSGPPSTPKDEPEEQKKGTKGDGISARSLAKILTSQYLFRVMDKVVYFYKKKYGFYTPLVGDDAEIIIRQCVPEKYSHKVTSYMVNEIILWMKADESLQVNPNALLERSKYINFENGVLKVKLEKLLFQEHTPELCFTNYVNAAYPYNCSCSGKLFDAFIERITSGDNEMMMLLQEIGGYILSEIRTIKKGIFFIGVSHSGKSTLIELFMRIVGEAFCSSLGFHEINEKFKLISIVGKKLNAAAEIGEINTDRFDIFKKLTGNDILMAEDKCVSPIQFRNSAALLFAGNEFPNSKNVDITNAFFNRLIVVPFMNGMEEKDHDHNLVDKIWDKERSYVVKWCVEGLQRLLRNNLTFTNCTKANEVKLEYVYEHNSFKAFIDRACILGPQYEAYTKDLLEAYKQFCLKNEMVKLNDTICHKYLKNMPNLKRFRNREGDHNRRGYTGIKAKASYLDDIE